MVEVDAPADDSIKLRVKAAHLPDVGKNIARIPQRYLEQLEITEGDLISIKGPEGVTTVTTYKALSSDETLEIIRMDGTIRENAGAGIDDYVTIMKTVAVHAEKVVLSPAGNHHLRGAEIYFKRELRNRPVSLGDKVRIKAGNRIIEYVISKLYPDKDTILICEDTEIDISTSKRKEERKKENKIDTGHVSYEDIGGLREKINMIREMVELPIRFPELFNRLGISPPKGLLMFGPPGTGKTLLARAVATEAKSEFFYISGPDILSKYAGESEKKLRELFDDAKKKAPSIIFIDEIDSITPKREESSDTTSMFVAQLLALMDGITGRGEVIVIGATNLPNSIDPALRRPGRFDREIEIGVPNKDARKEIFLIHTRNMPLDETVSIDKLSDMTYGFVGADIASLCREAAFRSIRRYLPEIEWESKSIAPEVLTSINVTMNDFLGALFTQKPSAMREVFVEIPNVSWDDVGGLDDIKRDLIETIVWPIKLPSLYSHIGIKPRGLLLFGPPGTGKTLIVRALASESKFNLIFIKGSELLSKWVGESEHAIRETFRKAKQVSPCIIFFDELDALTPSRRLGSSSGGEAVMDRVVSTLITEIDSLDDLSDVFIVAATNRPAQIDPALIRPGRFDRLVYVPLPDQEQREKILKVFTTKMPISSKVDFSLLAQKTSNASGSDLFAINKAAAMLAIRKYLDSNFGAIDIEDLEINDKIEDVLLDIPFSISQEDILEALKTVGYSTSDPRIEACINFAQEHGIL